MSFLQGPVRDMESLRFSSPMPPWELNYSAVRRKQPQKNPTGACARDKTGALTPRDKTQPLLFRSPSQRTSGRDSGDIYALGRVEQRPLPGSQAPRSGGRGLFGCAACLYACPFGYKSTRDACAHYYRPPQGCLPRQGCSEKGERRDKTDPPQARFQPPSSTGGSPFRLLSDRHSSGRFMELTNLKDEVTVDRPLLLNSLLKLHTSKLWTTHPFGCAPLQVCYSTTATCSSRFTCSSPKLLLPDIPAEKLTHLQGRGRFCEVTANLLLGYAVHCT
ncbi:hypothetical protein SKAU_G00419210 [Synaphobranchus kaupii]|uniref:Uncharacterized protein n=1 Tax=Synaphobranchus kaupii TaxID=118154 RepID=A0A9Q1E6I0_SYNKA|nr:hypothetical protein SKAU_G00419210 [Synaphobranchus kaupii]